MNRKIFAATLVVLAALFGFVILKQSRDTQTVNISSPSDKPAMVVYKTKTCGCCANFVTYMKREGYDVEVVDFDNNEVLNTKKRSLSIPTELDSCHTSQFKNEGYFVEGHIPVEATEKLLAEKPQIKGIGMPGMPSASPGMPGAKTEPFNISQVSLNGEASSYLKM